MKQNLIFLFQYLKNTQQPYQFAILSYLNLSKFDKAKKKKILR